MAGVSATPDVPGAEPEEEGKEREGEVGMEVKG
jgi:hypothetical protein